MGEIVYGSIFGNSKPMDVGDSLKVRAQGVIYMFLKSLVAKSHRTMFKESKKYIQVHYIY
jgi:hypothetical protein